MLTTVTNQRLSQPHGCITQNDPLRIAGLNVCGLSGKLALGTLDDFINAYDILCLCETKCDDIDISKIPNHSIYFADPPKSLPGATPPHGGVHGLCILVAKKIDSNCEVVVGTSNYVLWLKYADRVLDIEFVLGAIYIPHEGSKYYCTVIFF